MTKYKHLRAAFLTGTALAVVWAGSVSSAVAADLYAADPISRPAVDAINGKLEGFGGWADGRFGKGDVNGGALGSITFPVGPSFGVQLDGLAASRDGDFVGGGAGHIFTRDPEKYLFGVYGSGVGFSDRTKSWNAKAGVEAEAYFGRVTLSGVLGYERNGGRSDTFNGFAERARKGGSFFDYVDLSYYLTDDWKVSIGHRYTGRKHAAALGTEYLLPVQAVPVSAFVEGRVGEDDYKAVWAGLKIHFGGESATLIARQRESDPTNWLKDDQFSSSVKRRRTGVVTPPPPPPSCGSVSGCGCPCGPT